MLLFYLYTNKCVGLVNVFTLIFGHPLEMWRERLCDTLTVFWNRVTDLKKNGFQLYLTSLSESSYETYGL